MIELLIFLSGYAVGVLFSVILCQPMKNWQDGYDTAKKHYDNWDKGFDEGYSAAKGYYDRYDIGFKDGWHCAEKRLTEEKDERT